MGENDIINIFKIVENVGNVVFNIGDIINCFGRNFLFFRVEVLKVKKGFLLF